MHQRLLGALVLRFHLPSCNQYAASPILALHLVSTLPISMYVKRHQSRAHLRYVESLHPQASSPLHEGDQYVNPYTSQSQVPAQRDRLIRLIYKPVRTPHLPRISHQIRYSMSACLCSSSVGDKDTDNYDNAPDELDAVQAFTQPPPGKHSCHDGFNHSKDACC